MLAVATTHVADATAIALHFGPEEAAAPVHRPLGDDGKGGGEAQGDAGPVTGDGANALGEAGARRDRA